MTISLEQLAQVVRSIIEGEAGIPKTSFGCCVQKDRLVVKLPVHLIKNEVSLPSGVIKDNQTSQVITLSSQDHESLAKTAVAMLR